MNITVLMIGCVCVVLFFVLFTSETKAEHFRSRLYPYYYPSFVAPYFYPYRYYYNGPYPFTECVENLFGNIFCGNSSYLYY